MTYFVFLQYTRAIKGSCNIEQVNYLSLSYRCLISDNYSYMVPVDLASSAILIN